VPGALATVLVLGGTGQIGSEVCRVFADRRVLAPSHTELPFEDEASMAAFLDRVRPDLVFNATAFHQLDQCDQNPSRAFEVNALAVGSVAKLCAKRGIRFATVGTDYVFSGYEERPYTEDDREYPLNVYGISKLAGERFAAIAHPQTTIFRVSGVFGRSGFSNKGPSFVERMIALAEKGEPIRVVDNVHFSPTYAPHAAAVMREVLEGESSGLFHVTNTGTCTWYDLATEAIRAAGLGATVERTQYSNEGNAIQRPLWSALAHAELQRRGYAEPPSWQQGVADYVAERRKRTARLGT
jgi:dTDP-4-dehydrorhamnose reductase